MPSQRIIRGRRRKGEHHRLIRQHLPGLEKAEKPEACMTVSNGLGGNGEESRPFHEREAGLERPGFQNRRDRRQTMFAPEVVEDDPGPGLLLRENPLLVCQSSKGNALSACKRMRGAALIAVLSV